MDSIIYIHTNKSRDELIEILLTLLKNTFQKDVNAFYKLESADFSINIRINDDYNSKNVINFPKDYYRFHYFLEISTDEEIEQESIELTSKILQFMWGKGVPAVAECSFDDLLPKNGGYNQSDLPWPHKQTKDGYE